MSFKSVQSKIAKSEGVSKKSAGAILANASRNASSAAKKANPKLKRVKGGNTSLPASHPKAKALVEGRASNKACDAAFTNGNQRAQNLAMDREFDCGRA